jgi:predicted Zn-dependent protease
LSRDDEESADLLALRTLNAYYGHVADATTFLEAADDALTPPEWLSTHPDAQKRIKLIEAAAAQNGWLQTGEVTPSPFRNAADR